MKCGEYDGEGIKVKGLKGDEEWNIVMGNEVVNVGVVWLDRGWRDG
jgi:hypothetical protein